MSDAAAFERCLADGGVAVFPSDTVYGLACDPADAGAVERLYRLKRRPLRKPSAVMFFDLGSALEALPDLGERTRDAMRGLLPGGLTVLLPNPSRRLPLACGDDPASLGIRVPPRLDWACAIRRPVLQSSANLAGGADPRRLDQVPEEILEQVDLAVDGGELPGTPSTVIDLRSYEEDRAWSVLRPGVASEGDLASVLDRRVR